jgi:diketogulonate reductase-like aldo/keto reductase
MLEIVPDIAQSTHGIRNIFADIRNVPTRPHFVLGMFLLPFPVILSDNPRKKRLRILSTADDDYDFDDDDDDDVNLERIPLNGFGTYAVNTPQVIYNALRVGYRHLDLAENYNNLQHVKQALSQALAPLTEGGLGIERKDIWITMKVPVQSINNINALLNEVGTDYFDLLLYDYPFSMFDSKAQLRQSWIYMSLLKQSRAVKRIGISNFYASHLTKLFDVCREFNLEKPFANEIQINPYVYCLEKDTLDLCFQNNVQLIAYSPLGFNTASIVLQDTGMQSSIAEEIGISTNRSVELRNVYNYVYGYISEEFFCSFYFFFS